MLVNGWRVASEERDKATAVVSFAAGGKSVCPEPLDGGKKNEVDAPGVKTGACGLSMRNGLRGSGLASFFFRS